MINYISYRQALLKEIAKRKEKAVTDVGKFVKNEAKQIVPVDTGLLKSTIDYKVRDDKASVMIGANTFYAGFVEKGTSKQRAQPYLTPAAKRNIKGIQKIVQAHMKGGG